MLLICPKAAKLILGFFLLGLVDLDILLKVAHFDHVFDFIIQLGALLGGVVDIFVVGAVLIFVCIWLVFERVGAVYEGLVGYGVQDLLCWLLGKCIRCIERAH